MKIYGNLVVWFVYKMVMITVFQNIYEWKWWYNACYECKLHKRTYTFGESLKYVAFIANEEFGIGIGEPKKTRLSAKNSSNLSYICITYL